MVWTPNFFWEHVRYFRNFAHEGLDISDLNSAKIDFFHTTGLFFKYIDIMRESVWLSENEILNFYCVYTFPNKTKSKYSTVLIPSALGRPDIRHTFLS